MKCQLCGRGKGLFRCTDPIVGIVRTCSVCRFPRMKEFRRVQPPKDLVPAVRVGTLSDGTEADDVLVCIRPPAEHDVTGGEWELRKADKAG